jgi:hypothetical protein
MDEGKAAAADLLANACFLAAWLMGFYFPSFDFF